MATYYVDHDAGADVNAGTSEGAGNAWKTIAKAMGTVAAGDVVNVKNNGSYTEQDDATTYIGNIDTAGTITAPILFEGYGTTVGDEVRATLDAADTLVSCISSSLGAGPIYYVFKNFRFTQASGDGVDFAGGEDSYRFYNCRSDNHGARGFDVDDHLALIGCEVDSNGDWGIHGDDYTFLLGCEVHGNGGSGDDQIQLRSGSIINTLFYAPPTVGVPEGITCDGTTYLWIVNVTIDGDGDNLEKGIRTTGAMVDVVVANSIIYDCSVGISCSTALGVYGVNEYNLLNANFTDVEGIWAGDHLQTGAPAFTNEAGADYTLGSSSPAKAAGLDAGVLVGAASYVDIGAHQREEPAGGGGLLVHPGMNGGPNA